MSLLKFDNVNYRYPGCLHRSLCDIDLSVHTGDFVLLVGASGSGKSTLLRAGAGLVPHFYGGNFAGNVTVASLDSRTAGTAEFSRFVGFLAQDPETQIVMGTVASELAFGLENRGFSRAAVARGVEEVALALGIEDLLDRPTSELSGGQCQRVALGAAIAGRPRLLLLDEPTSQLDPVAGDELLGLLRRLNQEWGTAIVISEHRIERCISFADRVVAMDYGRIVCDGRPGEYLEWAADQAPELVTPAARMFSAAGLRPLPTSIKSARAHLEQAGVLLDDAQSPDEPLGESPEAKRRVWWERKREGDNVLRLRKVSHRYPDGPLTLNGLNVAFSAGEQVALMGRNGAGKSTLLRLAAGISKPTAGRIERHGRVALLMQNPGSYLIEERVESQASIETLQNAGLSHLLDRHPNDISGGERQRLALATVLDAGESPSVVCLDEPTRGMDRSSKLRLIDQLADLSSRGIGTIVATHDVEFAAQVSTRTLLLGKGEVIADGSTKDVLTGGWYFSTEIARVLGSQSGSLLPEDGAEYLRNRLCSNIGSDARHQVA